MATNFYELKSRWESGSISSAVSKETRKPSRHLGSREVSAAKMKASDEIVVSSPPLNDTEGDVEDDRESRNRISQFSESVEAESQDDEFYNGSCGESEPERFLDSDSHSEADSPDSPDSDARVRWSRDTYEFAGSFAEHLQELKSSLKFDSPETWLFGTMNNRRSALSEASSDGCFPSDVNRNSEKVFTKGRDDGANIDVVTPPRASQSQSLFSSWSDDVEEFCNQQSNTKPAAKFAKRDDFDDEKLLLCEDLISTGSPDLPDCVVICTPRQSDKSLKASSSNESSKFKRDENVYYKLRQSPCSPVALNECASEQIPNLRKVSPVCHVQTPEMKEDFKIIVERERKSVDGGNKNSKIAIRRSRVIQELLDTEVTYQNHLALVIKFFERPLQEMNILSNPVIVTIFGNIEQLMAVNTELLIHFKSLSIGEAFRRLGPFLKLYSTYANNHERALAALMEWDQKSPEFATFRRTQEDLPEMKSLKLNALLITPVQRIPRYKLLLEELRASTPKEHEDYHNIDEAVKQVSAVASHINDHIKQQDNFMKMLAIQRSLTGPVGLQILIPGRIFIKEGMLRKVSRKGRSQERMFYLFSDVLMYAKARLLDGAGASTFTCCCVLPLHHCKVNQVLGRRQGQAEGSLFSVQCKNELLLLYSDQKTVNSWISTLQKAVDEVQVGRQSLRKTSSAKEPVRGEAMIQFLKREKQKRPQNAKGARCFDNVKQRTKHNKTTAEKKNSSSTDSESTNPSDSSTKTTPRKRLLGFACLSKKPRFLPDILSPKQPKVSPIKALKKFCFCEVDECESDENSGKDNSCFVDNEHEAGTKTNVNQHEMKARLKENQVGHKLQETKSKKKLKYDRTTVDQLTEPESTLGKTPPFQNRFQYVHRE